MDENQSVPMATSSAELLQAQAELWCHTFGYLKSMALQCAIKLGIPCAIHRSGGAASLPELLAALSLAPSKQPYLSRLMRFLTASGIFTCAHAAGAKAAAAAATGAEGVYGLTPVSRLLAGVDQRASLSPFVLFQITHIQVNAALHLAEWFGNKDEAAVAETPFKMAHGADFWATACRDAELGAVFNDAMGSESRFLMDLVVRECRQVFKGIGSLIDVGGGNGAAARAIAKAFQHVKCTVLDLPQVVDGMPAGGDIIEFVAGDMMDFIPPADVVLLKYVLHDWKDEDCVKILMQCKKAISFQEAHGKVLIIDAVVGSPYSGTIYEAQLLVDLAMMVSTTGKEREEHEWQKIFMDAGFSRYKITPIQGIMSLIEVYPCQE